jgi:septum formation topological specificity factor MinE
MEQFNYHKLVNLRKRFNKYDCECSKEIISVIDKYITIEKKKSLDQKKDYQIEYQNEKVECYICKKLLLRKSLYTHMNRLHK